MYIAISLLGCLVASLHAFFEEDLLVRRLSACAGLGKGVQHQEDEQIPAARGEGGPTAAGDCQGAPAGPA